MNNWGPDKRPRNLATLYKNELTKAGQTRPFKSAPRVSQTGVQAGEGNRNGVAQLQQQVHRWH